MTLVKRYGCSLGLTVSLSGLLMSLYCTGISLLFWLIGITAASVLCFLFFEKIRSFGKKGALAYCAVLVLVLVLCRAMLLLGGRREFMSWLFRTSSPHNSWFQGAMALGAVFFVSSAVYYFTQILHRSAVLFLLMMIPFALYGKLHADFPFFWMLLTMVMLLVVWTQGRFFTKEKEMQFFFRREYFAAVIGFGTLAAALAWIMPHPIQTPYREEFDRFAERAAFGLPAAGEADFSGFTNLSGVNYGANQSSEKVLYEVNAIEELYFRAQVFDLYRPSGWASLTEEEYQNGWNHWEDYCSALSSRRLTELLQWAYEQDPTLFTKEQQEWIPGLTTKEETAEFFIYPSEGNKSYRLLLSNINQTDYDFISRAYGEDVYRTCRNEFFLRSFRNGAQWYEGTYYSNHFSSELPLRLTSEEFWGILNRLNRLEDQMSDAQIETFGAWQKEFLEAQQYRQDTISDYEGQELIRSLVGEITKDCRTEYEKAAAIERYFHEQDFIYDLNFVPQKDGTAYFLFESKRGICSDFASAMVLLAREAGLSARYVEGARTEPAESGEKYQYVIKSSGSHAFPEIYLPGNGWTIFEPTVPELGDLELFWRDYQLWILWGSFLFLLGMLIFFLRKELSEGIFYLRLAGSSRKNALSLMFKRLCRMAGKRFGKSSGAMTAGELSGLLEELSCPAGEFLEVFEKSAYGDFPCSAEEYRKAASEYRLCRKALIGKKKNS